LRRKVKESLEKTLFVPFDPLALVLGEPAPPLPTVIVYGVLGVIGYALYLLTTFKYRISDGNVAPSYTTFTNIVLNSIYINTFEIYDPKKHTINHDLNQFRFNGLLYTRSFWAVFLHTAFPNQPLIA
jgi:hypothetical protein